MMKPHHAYHRRETAGGGHNLASGRPKLVHRVIEALMYLKDGELVYP